MCGRYFVDNEEETIEMRQILQEINERYRNTELHAQMKIGEIFPTNVAPVLAADGAQLMGWGFPKWDGKGVIINARAETAHEKNMFRQSLLTRRCAIPSAGFFEWSHDAGPKIKYLCRLQEASLLLMAGIHNTFTDAQGNKSERYVILTTSPSDTMARLHDRMPVILRDGEREVWINDRGATMDILHRPGPELTLEAV